MQVYYTVNNHTHPVSRLWVQRSTRGGHGQSGFKGRLGMLCTDYVCALLGNGWRCGLCIMEGVVREVQRSSRHAHLRNNNVYGQEGSKVTWGVLCTDLWETLCRFSLGNDCDLVCVPLGTGS